MAHPQAGQVAAAIFITTTVVDDVDVEEVAVPTVKRLVAAVATPHKEAGVMLHRVVAVMLRRVAVAATLHNRDRTVGRVDATDKWIAVAPNKGVVSDVMVASAVPVCRAVCNRMSHGARKF
jgi:hypothetical protein